jgi:hypothetical protein
MKSRENSDLEKILPKIPRALYRNREVKKNRGLKRDWLVCTEVHIA